MTTIESIEQKAKAYDEAIKKLEDIMTGKCKKTFVFTEGLFDYIFPELKESEDERIWTINYLNNRKLNSSIIEEKESLKRAIAWLEKQGEKIDAIENFDTEFEKQVSCLIASTINKEHEYNEGFVKWTANALLNYAKRELEKDDDIEYTRTDAFIEKACEWLKKNADGYTWYDEMEGESGMTDEFIDDFKNYMKGE